MKRKKILIVDDEKLMRWSLSQKLSEWNLDAVTAEDGKTALNLIPQEMPDLIMLDNKLPDKKGTDLLKEIKSKWPELPVVMITAYGVVDDVVTAMRRGAYDFITKPIDYTKLQSTIKNAIETASLRKEVAYYKEKVKNKFDLSQIIAVSQKMKQIMDMSKKIAQSEASIVLLQGESGTGKDLLAQAIHNFSRRKDASYLAINCSAIPENLLESELFGYEKGAFTGAEHTKRGRFEMAHGGTLFLDEIGDISLKTQVDLLRVLQQKEFSRLGGEESIEVDVRILAATNRDLEKAIIENRFRKDLFYRLNVISIHVPPLRERKEDIPLLAKASVRKCCLELNKDEVNIAPSAMKLLVDYDWPGNVRELENIIERALVIGGGKEIATTDLPFTGRESMREQLPKSLKAMEKIHIERVIEEADWNISRAARELDIDRQTLYNKIEKYEIKRG